MLQYFGQKLLSVPVTQKNRALQGVQSKLLESGVREAD